MEKKKSVIKDAKEVDLTKMLTPDMAKAIDMLAYTFLKQLKYDTTDCDKPDSSKTGRAARKRVAKEINDKGFYLKWKMPHKDNHIYCFFEYCRKSDNKVMATSRSLEFVCPIVEIGEDGQPSE